MTHRTHSRERRYLASRTGISRRTARACAALLAALLTLAAAAQPHLVEAQREYQRSLLTAYYQQRIALDLPGSALPAGEYAWTMEFRCPTHEDCVEAFGFPLLPPWQESYTFVAHLTSDGERMSYSGANVYRGRAGAGEVGVCEDPNRVPFAGTCVFGESAEAFVRLDPTYPPDRLAGRPLLWVRNARLYAPLPDGGRRSLPCTCGFEGLPTPTLALLNTLHADYFAAGRAVPPGVAFTVQLLRLP